MSEINIPYALQYLKLCAYFYCITFDLNAERKISQSVRYLYFELRIWFCFKFSITLLPFPICLKTLNMFAFIFLIVSEV